MKQKSRFAVRKRGQDGSYRFSILLVQHKGLAMLVRSLLSIAIVFVLAGSSQGQETKAKPDPRIAPIQSMIGSYVEAFNEKKLDKVTGFWAEDCTYTDRTTGERVESREAMQADLKNVFEEQPKLKLAGTVDRVKFVTDDVAQVEGQTVMGSPELEPVRMLFSAILVKKGEGWQISSMEESAVPEVATPYEALKQLDWLVGRWVDQSGTATVENRVRWSNSAAFLIRSFTMHTDNGIAQEGTQVIGWDPRAKQIRSWAFNSDGSFGEGLWSKSGNDWLIKSSQTLQDGKAASGTYVLEKVNDDTLRIRLIGHTIDGAPQPASDAVTMMRSELPPTEEGEEATTESTSADSEAKPKP